MLDYVRVINFRIIIIIIIIIITLKSAEIYRSFVMDIRNQQL